MSFILLLIALALKKFYNRRLSWSLDAAGIKLRASWSQGNSASQRASKAKYFLGGFNQVLYTFLSKNLDLRSSTLKKSTLNSVKFWTHGCWMRITNATSVPCCLSPNAEDFKLSLLRFEKLFKKSLSLFLLEPTGVRTFFLFLQNFGPSLAFVRPLLSCRRLIEPKWDGPFCLQTFGWPAGADSTEKTDLVIIFICLRYCFVHYLPGILTKYRKYYLVF